MSVGAWIFHWQVICVCEIEVLVAVGHKVMISGDFEPNGLVEE